MNCRVYKDKCEETIFFFKKLMIHKKIKQLHKSIDSEKTLDSEGEYEYHRKGVRVSKKELSSIC